ncbi:MAG TPA: prepilin-type N-terminal cleavage/methylation domain-containing protein [Candidatus Paceibacterota bacterium]|nr:prepilin-type N-terminal cleavage/methylation domain-containing protein [Candidatus Paceibacterota bacterium]
MKKAENVKRHSGFTLIELIVATGVFALVMLLASGAYLMMISLNRQAQGLATGIDNLSFALETMTRDIRTGSKYSCGPALGLGDCTGGTSFSFVNEAGVTTTYNLSGTALQQMVGTTQSVLTEPAVTITSLVFYVYGSAPASAGDRQQAHVTMIISGQVSSSASKVSQKFTIETGATMRGSDI